MIHKACMPVYMNSGKIVTDGTGGELKVLQEVLADLKSTLSNLLIQNSPVISKYIFYFDIVEKMVLWLTPI